MKINMEFKIVNKSNNPLPEYATEDAAGMDIRAFLKEDIVIYPMGRVLIPTGLYIQLPKGYEAQIRPRSGLAFKHGLTVLNSPGTIDADYRGEIGIILVNLSNESFTVKSGERIAQMVIKDYVRATLNEADELDNDTIRGEGGFGHTGKQ